MITALKSRIYPSRTQEAELFKHLGASRFIYNWALEHYQNEYLDKLTIQNLLPELKQQNEWLQHHHSKMLQHPVHQLFRNLRVLKALKEKGIKVGKLRFKGRHYYRSFTYNQTGFSIIPTDHRHQTLRLSKIGDIPIRLHRTFDGNIKEVTIKHENDGRWYASLKIDGTFTDTSSPSPQLDAVAFDLGLTDYITDSNGNTIQYPFHYRNTERKLAKLQRRFSKTEKGSNNRNRLRTLVARCHSKIAHQRSDFTHKLSRSYINTYRIIFFDKLNVKDMLSNSYLSKSISDASWTQLYGKFKYKAESAGSWMVEVEPRGTTQLCSCCGANVPKTIRDRIHHCPRCGLILPRDLNSSYNIFNRGLTQLHQARHELGREPPEVTPPEWKALLDHRLRSLAGGMTPQPATLKEEAPVALAI
jgi:putative transposase